MTAAKRLRHALLLAVLLLAVAGCGSDAGQTETSNMARGLLKNLIGVATAGRAAEAAPSDAPTPDQIAAAALGSFAGPLMLVTLEAQGQTTVMGLYGENGPMRTYALPSEQSLILRSGILVGTRGFGFDMMSAETDAVAALILARKEGAAAKVQRYLDAENVERPLPMECAVSRGDKSEYEVAGLKFRGIQMVEICAFQGQAVGSAYLVSDKGAVLASRQWIGPELGYVTLQTLRP
jgi:hypothetical protein